MKSKIFVVFLLLVPFSVLHMFGQGVENEEIIVQRAKEKVAQLNDYISFMADPQMNIKTRNHYKSVAQKLFINECNGYDEILEYVDGSKKVLHREGVTMGVASVRRTTPRQKPMRQYFRGLMSMTYKAVQIQTTEIADMRVSKLQPYGKDAQGRTLYTCSVYFDQVFVGHRRDGGVYKDLTRKWVVCYVSIDDVFDPETGSTYPEYMVQLGDVYVISVERIF